MKTFKTDTVYNADCIKEIVGLPDNCVDVSFTSPPYNRIRNDTYQLYDDTKSDEEYLKFLVEITKQMIRITKRDVIVNLQMNHFNKWSYCKFIGEFADNMRGMIVWEKTNPQPASNPKNGTWSITNAYEMFFVLGKDNKEFRAYNKIKNHITSAINDDHYNEHGAIMKREIAEWFIENFTKENDVVFDPFMGTGTTAVACYLHDRHWFGFEIVPEYAKFCDFRLEQVYCEKNQLTMEI